MKTLTAAAIAMLAALMLAGTAGAAPTPVLLLTASPFAILTGDHLSDVPTSTIIGDVGLSPAAGSFITGLTCAEVTGTIYAPDATGLPCFVSDPARLTTARTNFTAALTDAAGRIPDQTYVTGDNQLGAQTLVAGVYNFGHATTANLIGDLTLTGNADSVWIFQATSDLVTAASSRVILSGGAQACNVFWVVNSTATLHASSTFVGTLLVRANVILDDAVTVDGRLLTDAPGFTTLIHDTITAPTTCLTQAQVDSAAAAAAAAQAQAAAAAAAAAAAQAAADQAAAAAAAANVAAAEAAAATAAANAAAATRAAEAARAAAARAAAVRARAAVARAAAVRAARAAQVARAAAARARRSRAIALRRASVRAARISGGFTG